MSQRRKSSSLEAVDRETNPGRIPSSRLLFLLLLCSTQRLDRRRLGGSLLAWTDVRWWRGDAFSCTLQPCTLQRTTDANSSSLWCCCKGQRTHLCLRRRRSRRRRSGIWREILVLPSRHINFNIFYSGLGPTRYIKMIGGVWLRPDKVWARGEP